MNTTYYMGGKLPVDDCCIIRLWWSGSIRRTSQPTSLFRFDRI